ncbi:coronatine-insensitive protein 1-like isoform X2 [Diospyros lotus]|nr:coronatine-insensitive protein 1-like isoform X2 [Diospyros lotus]XP_052187591.1 coronatine-insensitive protein 1-like isoform X2 [Diospyros lotus]
MTESSTGNSASEAAVDTVFECVVNYIKDPHDLGAVSLVCRRWYEIEAAARKHVKISLCYAATPEMLRRRFPNLESLKLKGKPRAAMFNLIPENWGGYVAPWVDEIAASFSSLKALHFRRMIIADPDLRLLAQSRGSALVSLKLDKCSGFSTDGLLHIARASKNLRTLFLEESTITEKDGEWLHELALNNTVLETLNFYMTYLTKVRFQDLELIARNCHSLVSVKISEFELLDLVGFFRAAAALEEFSGGSFSEQPEMYSSISFSPKLRCLGLTYMGRNEMPLVFPSAFRLRRLDLLYALLDTDDHCILFERCPNLEVLETRNVIGDRGLEVLAVCCKRLRRLRIERGADEQRLQDEGGGVSHRGLIALAHGCAELAYLAVYVSDIDNASLECIGTYLKKLTDFRLVLLDREERVTDLPLDNGVRALLQGCHKLRRFGLYLRPRALTDQGLGYIGQYSQNVRWMLLGYVGESDAGLLALSRGCPSLQKLEIRCCCFSERALALAVLQLTSLRYFWVQGYLESETGLDNILAMNRPFWNIELIPAREEVFTDHFGDQVLVIVHPSHILSYYSLAGQRTDHQGTVVLMEEALLYNNS